ncbi:MAG: hypothetical protein EPN79_11445 [Burkholderiaceae bacterium]|nr:MAG: hypothetical protein EPN79_11445 [Burkholderiaceae bacterium]TBR76700.1 MAG: hypothetical protein EPN64_05620 [Burkholderiaceae bacterium]
MAIQNDLDAEQSENRPRQPLRGFTRTATPVPGAAATPRAFGFGFQRPEPKPVKPAGFGFNISSLPTLPKDSDAGVAELMEGLFPDDGERPAAKTPTVSADVTHVGVIERVSIYSDWAVGSMNTQERESLKITGTAVAHLKEGCEYVLTGRMKTHREYGEQLEVISFEPHIRPDEASILKFIVSNFTNVGKKTAERFVAQTKESGGQEGLEALRLKLISQPWEVTFESVSTRSTSFAPTGGAQPDPDGYTNPAATSEPPELPYVQRMLATKFGALRDLKASVLKLLATSLFAKVRAAGKSDVPVTDAAAALLAQDPYSPMRTIPGYGFRSADAIGTAMNIPRDAPVRLSALASFLVNDECESSGHVYLSEAQLRISLSRAEPTLELQALLKYGEESGDLILVEGKPGGRRIYPAALHATEQRLAHDLHDMLTDGKPLLVRRTFAQFKAKAIEVSKKLLGYELDEDQIKALHGIATSESRLHVISAGPGCGKTAIMEVFSAMMRSKKFEFTAPTGMASKVLTSRVQRQGYHASTMHSLLKGSPDGGFNVNREAPLSCDILVVDEGTMPTLQLFEAATAALPPRAHMIILGDPGVGPLAGQLPSIGPGRVMSDLLRLPGVDHHHLTAVKRNSGGILEVVNEIRAGALNCEDRDGVTFSNTLPDATTYFPTVAARYMDLIAKKGIENVVLLISRRAGEQDVPSWCSDYANTRLRDLVNPGGPKIPGTQLHIGDRIIIRDNMVLGKDKDGEDIRVVNGDKGTIAEYHPFGDPKKKGAQALTLILDDERTIMFPGDSVNELQLSYATTVHMSQGSEYKDVMLVMTPGRPSFMNQNMFLTGASRPREHLWVYGNDADLKRIAATPLPARNTSLVEFTTEMLQETLRQIESHADETPKV